jgi:hypothetical protein
MPMKCDGENKSKFVPSAWMMNVYKVFSGGFTSPAIRNVWKSSDAAQALRRANQTSAMAKIMALATSPANRLSWLNLLAQRAANAWLKTVVPDPYSLMRATAFRPISIPTPPYYVRIGDTLSSFVIIKYSTNILLRSKELRRHTAADFSAYVALIVLGSLANIVILAIEA